MYLRLLRQAAEERQRAVKYAFWTGTVLGSGITAAIHVILKVLCCG